MKTAEINRNGVEWFKTGEDKYFNKIYPHLRNILKTSIHLRTMEEADKLIIIDDVLLHVYNNIKKYNPIYSFTGWAFLVAKNKAYKAYEKIKRKNYEGAHMVEITELHLVAEDEPDNFDEHKWVLNEISKLKKPYDDIMYRKYYKYETFPDLSEEYGIHINTMRANVHNYTKKIRQNYENQFE